MKHVRIPVQHLNVSKVTRGWSQLFIQTLRGSNVRYDHMWMKLQTLESLLCWHGPHWQHEICQDCKIMDLW